MLELFDTLSRRKKAFRPLEGDLVRIYTCGPSVYAYSHIGNFRTYLFEDILVRYLMYKGYKVKRVMNITDVEDKAIIAARRESKTLGRLQKDKIDVFFSDFRRLGMLRPDVVALASRHVPQMIALIKRICKKGHCLDDQDGIYFDVRSFRRYGELSRLKKRTYFGRSRKDDYSKAGLWDFRLWKRWTAGDGKVRWKSPFGDGRPGWHIECSTMSMHHLGESFDIHCGGIDNMYPHHENEIAQSESAAGKRLANFWLHSRHLTIGKRKMSKRTGNVLYVNQLIKKGIHPRCLRFYLISERYRNPLDFTMERFERVACGCERTRKLVKRLKRMAGKGDGWAGRRIAKGLIDGFERSMDDDLDTRSAFKLVFKTAGQVEGLLDRGRISRGDAYEISRAFDRIDSVLEVF